MQARRLLPTETLMRMTFALVALFGFIHQAAIAAPFVKKELSREAALVEHRFDLNGCPFTLKDHPSLVFLRIDVESRKSGVYRVIDDQKTAGGISISFICDEKPARTFCPENTNVVDPGESDHRYLEDLRIIRYDQISDAYYGIASAYNLTAVPRPRPRHLVWCIGDDQRVLWGEASVGSEKHEYTDRILKILRTIRFVDSLDPERSNSQDSPAPNDNTR